MSGFQNLKSSRQKRWSVVILERSARSTWTVEKEWFDPHCVAHTKPVKIIHDINRVALALTRKDTGTPTRKARGFGSTGNTSQGIYGQQCRGLIKLEAFRIQ